MRNNPDPEVLRNLHLYHYHRLPPLDRLNNKDLGRMYNPEYLSPRVAETFLDIAKKVKGKNEDKKSVSHFMKLVNTMSNGSSFGELALSIDTREGARACRLVSVTECHLIIVTRKDY